MEVLKTSVQKTSLYCKEFGFWVCDWSKLANAFVAKSIRPCLAKVHTEILDELEYVLPQWTSFACFTLVIFSTSTPHNLPSELRLARSVCGQPRIMRHESFEGPAKTVKFQGAGCSKTENSQDRSWTDTVLEGQDGRHASPNVSTKNCYRESERGLIC